MPASAAAPAPKVGTPTTAHHEPARDASASSASTSEVPPLRRGWPAATATVLPRRSPRLGSRPVSSGATGSTRWPPAGSGALAGRTSSARAAEPTTMRPAIGPTPRRVAAGTDHGPCTPVTPDRPAGAVQAAGVRTAGIRRRRPSSAGWCASAERGLHHRHELFGGAEQVVGLPGADHPGDAGLGGGPLAGAGGEEAGPLVELGGDGGRAATQTLVIRLRRLGGGPGPGGEQGGRGAQRRQVGGGVAQAVGAGLGGLDQPAPGQREQLGGGAVRQHVRRHRRCLSRVGRHGLSPPRGRGVGRGGGAADADAEVGWCGGRRTGWWPAGCGCFPTPHPAGVPAGSSPAARGSWAAGDDPACRDRARDCPETRCGPRSRTAREPAPRNTALPAGWNGRSRQSNTRSNCC